MTRPAWLHGPLVAALVLTGLSVSIVWSVDYLPTNDGPQHVFASYASRHIDDPATGYGRYLMAGAPLSSVGFDGLFGPVAEHLPWRVALRVWLTVAVLFWAWGYFALAWAVERERSPLGLLGFASAFGWTLYMGFFSFYFATGFGFLLLAFAFSAWPWQGKHHLALAAGLLAQSVFHVFAAILTGIALLLIAAVQSPPGKRLRALAAATLMGTPAAALALISALTSAQSSASFPARPFPLSIRATLLSACFISGPPWRAWPPTIAALASAGLAVYLGAWRAEPRTRALLLTGLPLAAGAVFLPVHIRGWQFFSVRFVPLGMGLLLLCLPLERLTVRLRTLAASAVFVFTVAAMGWAWHYNRSLVKGTQEALAGLDAPLQRSGPRLTVTVYPEGKTLPGDLLARPVPFAAPLLHLGALYAVSHGGTPPGLFIGMSDRHQITARVPALGPVPDSPPKDLFTRLTYAARQGDLDTRRRLLDEIVAHVPSGFEDVAVYGDVSDVEHLVARGFVLDWRNGGAAIARFQGCPTQLSIEGAHEVPVLVAVGWSARRPPLFRTRVPPGPAEGSPRVIRIGSSPCGSLLLNVVFDRDDNGAPSPGDSFCASADALGTWRAEVSPSSLLVTCTPR